MLKTAKYKNLTSRKILAEKVLEMLNLMAEDDELKTRAVDIIYNSLKTCDDRIISEMDEIELMVEINKIEKGKHTKKELRKLGMRFLLLEMVQKKAEENKKNLTRVDEIEIYLAFQIGLADRFELPIKTRNMNFTVV